MQFPNRLLNLITKDVHFIFNLLNVNHFHITENVLIYLYGLLELCKGLPQTENSKMHVRFILFVQHRQLHSTAEMKIETIFTTANK